MQTNVGTADRVIRIAAGLGLLSLVFMLDSDARWWGLVASFWALFALVVLGEIAGGTAERDDVRRPT